MIIILGETLPAVFGYKSRSLWITARTPSVAVIVVNMNVTKETVTRIGINAARSFGSNNTIGGTGQHKRSSSILGFHINFDGVFIEPQIVLSVFGEIYVCAIPILDQSCFVFIVTSP